jgi:hypothetical protein
MFINDCLEKKVKPRFTVISTLGVFFGVSKNQSNSVDKTEHEYTADENDKVGSKKRKDKGSRVF